MDVRADCEAAEARIRSFVRETPLEPSPRLGDKTGGEVWLKLENLQWTGSFKYRGATNKLLSLDDRQRNAGIITASTGNHGLAVAHALERLGLSGTIFLPETASPRKVKMLRRYPVKLEFFGSDSVEAEKRARRVGRESGKTFISPYNDPAVIGGQGTVGLEINRQEGPLDAVLVSVGGGGLIAGIGGSLKETRPGIRIIGCLPENSPVMYDSIRAGRIVDTRVRPTLSDGTAGGIEPDAITFELCQKLVDDWILVEEEEIRRGIRFLYRHHRQVVEGSAAVAVASLMKTGKRFRGKQIAVVICGGNIDPQVFRKIVGSEPTS